MSPPILISGTAGSGKTTISIYFLLKNAYIDKKRVFITYNNYLKRFSEDVYSSLVKNSDLENKSRPLFLTFKETLKEIFNAFDYQFDWKKYVDFHEFEGIISNNPLAGKYDAELIWEEIRAIIKGAKPQINVIIFKKLFNLLLKNQISKKNMEDLSDYLLGLKNLSIFDKINHLVCRKCKIDNYDLFVQNLAGNIDSNSELFKSILSEILSTVDKKNKDLTFQLLSFDEYRSLGRKRAPNFIYDRKDIYALAEYYQNKLNEENRRDEIDLTKIALDLLEKNDSEAFKFDLVVCDEVQDFTEIQLQLIFKLAKDYNNILFSGDPKQIINPSGFRWEEVKNKFFERGVNVPEVVPLKLNFRSVGSIVKFANSLLDLKQKLVGISNTEYREEYKFNGKPIAVIHKIKESEMLSKLKISSAGRIILVRDSNEMVKLKRELKSELIFTISDAKGLEFDTVLVWKFLNGKKSKDIWRKIEDNSANTEERAPYIKNEINLLYVASTRARTNLIFYDGEKESEIWKIESLEEHIYKTNDTVALSEVWNKISSPKDWEKQGDYFFEREHYKAALECYKNSGNIEKSSQAEAYIYEAEKNYVKAAELFEHFKDFERAAINYELAENYQKSLKMWKLLNREDKAIICRIKIFELNGEHNNAADEWEKLGDIEAAFKNWEKAKNYKKMAAYYKIKKDIPKLADISEKIQDYKAAAGYYKKLKRDEDAARCYYKSGDYANAVKLYKKLRNTEELYKCYKELKDYYNLGKLSLSKKEVENALFYFNKFLEIDQNNREILENNLKRARKNSLDSAVYNSLVGDKNMAGDLFLAYDYTNLAIEQYKETENHFRLFRAYELSGAFYEAGIEVEKIPENENLNLALVCFNKFVFNKQTKKSVDKNGEIIYNEAEKYFSEGDYKKAYVRYGALNMREETTKTLIKLKNDNIALLYFTDREYRDELSKYIDTSLNNNVTLDAIKIMVSYVDAMKIDYKADRHKDSIYFHLIIKLLYKIVDFDNEEDEKLLYLKSLLETRRYSIMDYYSKEYLLCLLKLKLYNDAEILFTSIKEKETYNPISEEEKKDLEDYLHTLKDTQDKNIKALYYNYFDDETNYAKSMNELPVAYNNTYLFDNKENHVKLVDFYIKENKLAAAMRIARSFNNNLKIAEIYELKKDYARAEKYYEKAKKPKKSSKGT
jgi:tetratricopeptide (TPR) repeat protein